MFALSARCNHVGSGFKFYMNMNMKNCVISKERKTIPDEDSFWRTVTSSWIPGTMHNAKHVTPMVNTICGYLLLN